MLSLVIISAIATLNDPTIPELPRWTAVELVNKLRYLPDRNF